MGLPAHLGALVPLPAPGRRFRNEALRGDDPHGDHLADARAKLRALADFADRFSDRFVRVESVAQTDGGTLRVLDLADPAVRADVLAFEGGKGTALYQSEHSRAYR